MTRHQRADRVVVAYAGLDHEAWRRERPAADARPRSPPARARQFLGRRRDDVEVEAMALDTVFQKTGQQRDVAFEADATANLGKVLAPHAPVFRVVTQQ